MITLETLNGVVACIILVFVVLDSIFMVLPLVPHLDNSGCTEKAVEVTSVHLVPLSGCIASNSKYKYATIYFFIASAVVCNVM